jgi:GH24 family phage-related lysozyme (muramidase)
MTNAISANGLALIRHYEGFRAKPTRLPDGNWLVGYSHVRIGEPGGPLKKKEAADLLALDVAAYEKLVNTRVTQPLNQAQFDALVSFAFSVGAEAFDQSQVLRRVNAGEFVAAACAMDAWRKADIDGESVVIDSFVRRRATEKALFLRDMPHDATSSACMRAKLDFAASVLGAPVHYAPAPELRDAPDVTLAPEAAPRVEPAQRLTEILKSEPATAAVLLTQVVAEDVMEDEGEIVTAHAKPVARPLDRVREATRRAYEAAEANRWQKKILPFFKRAMREQGGEARMPAPDWGPASGNAGLIALLVFGIGLIAWGGSLLFDGEGDLISIGAAAALVTPGLAATMMAAIGVWRGQMKPARA